jgi:hypothetical protein
VIRTSDPEVLEIAAESGRILVSHDRKTMVRHFMDFADQRSSPGLIIVSQDLDIGLPSKISCSCGRQVRPANGSTKSVLCRFDGW